eukprot:COSAG06_NODE_1859_length_8205_cov_15.172095_6_plen_96_part_00
MREIRARYPNHDPELNAVIGGKYLVHDGRAGLLNLTKVIIRKRISFCAIYTYKRSFYQDRLGTNIGKALKKRDAFSYLTKVNVTTWIPSGATMNG